MAFTDMDDVEQELGEEKPPQKNGNRTFLIIAGTLAGIIVLALLCIGGLALFRYLPAQRATQYVQATNAALSTADAFAASQTAAIPTATMTTLPTYTQTSTPKPTNTPIIVLAPTNTPTSVLAVATRYAMLTQIAATYPVSTPTEATQVVPTLTKVPPTVATPTKISTPTVAPHTLSVQATATQRRPTVTALPGTGIADELGTPGFITIAFVLVAIIFLARRLRATS